MGSSEHADSDPPLLAGKVQGVRAWHVLGAGSGGAALLGSRVSSTYWPPDRSLSAECDASDGDSSHAAPERECGCGIYAWHPTQALGSVDVVPGSGGEGEEDLNTVVGVIEAWGRIEVHWSGFRAEWASPVALFLEAGAAPERRRTIEALAASYGVSIIEIDDEAAFAAHCFSLPGGLDPVWVEQLLSSSIELTLERNAVGYLSGRNRTSIGGSGYVLEGAEPPDRWKPELEVDLPGVRVARVAGAVFHPHALQDSGFDPGRPLRLLPEPHNRHDPDAIGIWDEQLRLQAGYVPAEMAPGIGRMLREGRLKTSMSLWQWRDLNSGERVGLHALLSASDDVRVARGKAGRQRNMLLVLEDEIEW